jgi:hypothetical protein
MQANNKTLPTDESVLRFLGDVADENRRNDSMQLLEIMRRATGVNGKMWGSAIVGFGTHHYVYETGREGDTVAVGFSPRKQALVLYGLFHYEQNSEAIALASKLGTHTSGKGCLYIKRLSDVDLDVLSQMITAAYKNRVNT